MCGEDVYNNLSFDTMKFVKQQYMDFVRCYRNIEEAMNAGKMPTVPELNIWQHYFIFGDNKKND
jgi:hypothetical protein